MTYDDQLVRLPIKQELLLVCFEIKPGKKSYLVKHNTPLCVLQVVQQKYVIFYQIGHPSYDNRLSAGSGRIQNH